MMVDLRAYLKNRLIDVISAWDADDVYAVSFFVYSNESYEYRGYSNVTEFSVGYNTERDCQNADLLSEERWNFAYWSRNNTPIIEADDENEGMSILFDWYRENGIVNIGFEDYASCFDSEMRYVGKGPVGYYELLSEITAVAKELQESGFIKDKFSAPIPIIIHDLEYSWYAMEATLRANQNGEADIFLSAMKKLGVIE